MNMISASAAASAAGPAIAPAAARNDLDAEHRFHFDFALGKALEDRADFADSIDANAVHGSDAAETAAVEIAFFFPGMNVYSR